MGDTTVRAHLEQARSRSNDAILLDYTALAVNMGQILAKLHNVGMLHGDLTTSNMMIQSNGSLVLIDFGLARVSSNPEELAVDLYVLNGHSYQRTQSWRTSSF